MPDPNARRVPRPRSPFLAWPEHVARPPLDVRGALHGFELTQWEAEGSLRAGRRAQLRLLLEWAVRHVPHYGAERAYADALRAVSRRPEAFDAEWPRLPLLTKEMLRELGPRVRASTVPAGHAPVLYTHTSGSTGIPVEVGSTALTRAIWDVLTVRDHLWRRRDFMWRLGVAGHLEPEQRKPGGADFPSWGPPVALLYSTGPASTIHVGYPLEEVVAWLRRFDPHTLLTFPSMAAALLDCLGGDRPASLREMRFFGEPLPSGLAILLGEAWKVRCSDVYSATEVGYIASQCPEQNRLHVHVESVHVEILDERGEPCPVGATGRVVVTSLHNLATPLLRYELGDLATVGEPCTCGRKSPTIAQVHGRVRNMACTPEGRRFFPGGLPEIRRVAPIRQAQYVQEAPNRIVLRVVLDRPLTETEERAAADFVRETLAYPYEVSVVPVPAIGRGPGGKFEEFVSRLAKDGAVVATPGGA